MKDNFQWDDKLVQQFAEEYRFSSSRISIEQFKSSKAPKKEWEIVAFKQGGKIFETYIDGGSYRDQYGNPINLFSELAHDLFIHSVRRLSDGEVFSVGDRIKGYEMPIQRFELCEMAAGGLKIVCEKWHAIRCAEKLPSPPFVTTGKILGRFTPLNSTTSYPKASTYSTSSNPAQPFLKNNNKRDMTPEQIQQDNELIAVFDGWEIIPGNKDHKCFSCDEGKGPSMFCTCDQKKTRYRKESTTNDRPPYYNLHWEVLMPVVIKISQINNGSYGLNIDPHGIEIRDYSKAIEKIIITIINDDDYPLIELYNMAIIDFIKWYNEQNKQP